MDIGIGPLQERVLPTPFGAISLPGFGPLKKGPLQVDHRRGKALRHALAADLTRVFGSIPYVGGIIGGQLANLHGAEAYKILTPEERVELVKASKRLPFSLLPMIYSFVER